MALRPKRAAAFGGAFEGALEAGFSVAIGVVLGYYADRWLDTGPWLLFFFMIVGAIAGFQRLLRIRIPPATGPSDEEQDGGGPEAN